MGMTSLFGDGVPRYMRAGAALSTEATPRSRPHPHLPAEPKRRIVRGAQSSRRREETCAERYASACRGSASRIAAALAWAERSPTTYQPDPKLVEAAQKEGEVLLYTTQIVDQIVRPLIKGFQSHVPGVQIKYRARRRPFAGGRA